MKTSPFKQHINGLLSQLTGETVSIIAIHPEYGGNINESFCLETNAGKYFLKRNESGKFPKMYESESSGLTQLRLCSNFIIPKVFGNGTFQKHDYLLMEYIEKGKSDSKKFHEDFAIALAQLHRNSNEHFGLSHNNYIGSLPQSNHVSSSWPDFFASQRLVPMVSMAHRDGKITLDTVRKFEKLCFRMAQLFPEEKPALIHGDLWSGNYLGTNDGKPCLFDPAVYFGNREMDIAMMHLFGGFHSDIFKLYNDEFPLQPEWEQRIDLCNLYPLLVHVNLFGGNYVKQMLVVLERYL